MVIVGTQICGFVSFELKMVQGLEEFEVRSRTGTLWSASCHIITSVIGAAVVSLPWSVAQLGWVLGTLMLLAFALVTYYTAILQTECYRSPDPVTGTRNYKYTDAVKNILGGQNHHWCMIAQMLNLYGGLVGYTLTSATCMMAIKKADCFHFNGRDEPCRVSGNVYLIMFGVVEIILSILPSLENISWLSLVAAVMSFAYSFIGLGLSVAKVAGGNNPAGSVMGVPTRNELSDTMKIWQCFQALGNIAFSYSFAEVLIEIQDTIKSPPAEKETMKKATLIGMGCTTLVNCSIGIVGYAAFGNKAPGNMLAGFYEPFWLIDIANVCVVIHMVGAFQVFVQPMFEVAEGYVSKKLSPCGYFSKVKKITTPFGMFEFSFFRLTLRSTLVASTTLLALLLPFFNDILGLIGAVSFWPLTVFFPVEMYIAQTKIPQWSTKWIVLQTLSAVCLVISLASAVGSVAGIIQSLKHATLFNVKG